MENTSKSKPIKERLSNRVRWNMKNVWIEFNSNVKIYKPLNLGQGFPNFEPHLGLLKELSNVAILPDIHSYPPIKGFPEILEGVAKVYSELFGFKISAEKEVITAMGAYNVLFTAIYTFIAPGDEVLIIDPSFDAYRSLVVLALGVPISVSYDSPELEGARSADEFILDISKLDAAVTNKTKMLILNNPNNPIGKSLTMTELKEIADFCIKHDIICLSDEVYEHLIFDGRDHFRIATLDGMWNRTISVYSAGKIFSATGWKLGWGIGPEKFINPMANVVMDLVMCGCGPLQLAVARVLDSEREKMGTPECYFTVLRDSLQTKRDIVYDEFCKAGFTVYKSTGTYFMLIKMPKIAAINEEGDPKESYSAKIVNWLMKEVGIGLIPVSAFYSQENAKNGNELVRICFAKDDATIKGTVEKIKIMREKLLEFYL